MVGLPWSQHVAFLDDRALKRGIRREIARAGRELGDHPAVLAVRARQRDSAGRRALARPRARRALPARPLRGREGARRPTACSPTSTFRRPSFSISRSSTSARSTSTCTASTSCAPTWRGCSTSPARSRCCSPKRAPTAFAKARTARPTITAMHIRAAFEEGACGAIAFAWTDEWWRGGHPVDDWKFGLVDRERRPKPAAARGRRRRSTTRRSRASGSATWPRVSVVVCAYNAADTLEDYLRSLEQLTYPDYEIILVNDGSTDRTSEIGRAHSRRARHRHAERRPERRAQRRAGRSDRRDRRLHRRRHARRSRLADVPRPAVPHLRRRRLRRAERRAARRSADRAVHRARAGRADARAARRSHRRARARLQHGVPPRRAARDRRLQPDLPPRRRRCGRVLAAAGARLEDRLRVGGARLASPSRRRSRPTGGSRSATAKAKPG